MTEKLSYSTAEAAEAVGVSKDTIHRAIRAGRLEARYVTKHPVIPRAALLAWIESAPTERAS